MNNVHDADAPTLEDYRDMIVDTECRFCEVSLKGQLVDHYNHADGWPVQGFELLQWLTIKCPKCGYEWSIWKLGIPRYRNELEMEGGGDMNK